MLQRVKATAAVLLAGVVGLTGIAQATFSASAAGTAELGAATLRNASSFAAACAANTPTSAVTLTWVASPDAFVTSYEITRSGTGGTVTLTAAANATTLSDSPPTGAGRTYTYTIAARVQGWSTPPSAGSTVSYTGGGGGNKCV